MSFGGYHNKADAQQPREIALPSFYFKLPRVQQQQQIQVERTTNAARPNLAPKSQFAPTPPVVEQVQVQTQPSIVLKTPSKPVQNEKNDVTTTTPAKQEKTPKILKKDKANAAASAAPTKTPSATIVKDKSNNHPAAKTVNIKPSIVLSSSAIPTPSVNNNNNNPPPTTTVVNITPSKPNLLTKTNANNTLAITPSISATKPTMLKNKEKEKEKKTNLNKSLSNTTPISPLPPPSNIVKFTPLTNTSAPSFVPPPMIQGELKISAASFTPFSPISNSSSNPHTTTNTTTNTNASTTPLPFVPIAATGGSVTFNNSTTIAPTAPAAPAKKQTLQSNAPAYKPQIVVKPIAQPIITPVPIVQQQQQPTVINIAPSVQPVAKKQQQQQQQPPPQQQPNNAQLHEMLEDDQAGGVDELEALMAQF